MTKKARFLILLVVLGIGATLIYPTINWYFLLDKESKDLAALPRERIRQHAQENAADLVSKLLDLSTSTPEAEIPADYLFVVDIARAENAKLRREQPANFRVSNLLDPFLTFDKDAKVIKNDQGKPVIKTALLTALEKKYREDILAFKKMKNNIIQLGLDLSGGMSVVLEANADRIEERRGEKLNDVQYNEALDLAVEVLKGRIDTFGITEPSVRKDEAAKRIFIDIPGDSDRERVNAFLLGGGSLALQIVDDTATQSLITHQNSFKDRTNLPWTPEREDPTILATLQSAGGAIIPYVKRDTYGIDYTVHYIIVKTASEFVVDGSFITEAQVVRDQLTGVPNVNFVMTSDGGEKFRVLTKDNINSSMAIVLDGKVRASANITSEIGGGSVRITGFNAEDANSISKVLKTGALPIDLRIESIQSVGASLGEDAIKAGSNAILYGLVAVLVFMLIYYLGAGLIANIALVLNAFIMIATLSALNLTMTLTSIAGFVLTIGMAVDANVIIFERIKEELRLGKGRAASIAAGYQKAFWSIADSNITTIIASVLLAFLGTGPIRGFAVTLTVGVLTSMFTSLFVTHLFQDFGTEQLKRTKMSIAWRLK